jgi:hypothetical protein
MVIMEIVPFYIDFPLTLSGPFSTLFTPIYPTLFKDNLNHKKKLEISIHIFLRFPTFISGHFIEKYDQILFHT